MPTIPYQVPVGTRFFRWVTLTEVRLISNKTGRYIQCRCDCGTVKEVLAHDLKTGSSVSCKCFNKEVNSQRKTTHGGNRVGKRERLYSIWKGMKSRCSNPRIPSYSAYGARGITVCEQWRGDYVSFRNWALASGYHDDLEIDRRDNDGGYCPENCRWVTHKQNANNKQQSVYLTAFGETKTMIDWANDPRCVPQYGALQVRVRNGWETEKALTTTPKFNGVRKKKGE